MGSEPDFELNSTPKLSLFSLPISNPYEPPGLSTPPIHTLASIPFQWEEAPGKPRLCTTTTTNHHHQQPNKSKTARCLELPPRLLNEAKVNNISSPTTVLDGPYLSRSRSLSFGRGRSSSNSLENLGRRSNKERGIFGSSQWGSFRKKHKEVIGDALDFSPSSNSDIVGGDPKVKITRVRRKSSFLSFSSSRSHFWTNIYGSIKQVVPWKRW